MPNNILPPTKKPNPPQSVLDSVMTQIDSKQPEKVEIVNFRRVLTLCFMGVGLFLASIVFTLFLIDIADKLVILEFAGRSPLELIYKLALEFIAITALFATLVYIIYRQTVLPYSKNRFQLFAGISTITILFASFGMVVVQSNIGDVRNRVAEFKDNIVQVLPIKHDLDPRRELFMGMVEENTPEHLDARMMDISERFFWQKDYEEFQIGENVIVKYRVNPNGNKIIDKIKRSRPMMNAIRTDNRGRGKVSENILEIINSSESESSSSIAEQKKSQKSEDRQEKTMRSDNSGKSSISDDQKSSLNSGRSSEDEHSNSVESTGDVIEREIESQKEQVKNLEDKSGRR
jgi:hypothetical protein